MIELASLYHGRSVLAPETVLAEARRRYAQGPAIPAPASPRRTKAAEEAAARRAAHLADIELDLMVDRLRARRLAGLRAKARGTR